MEKLRTFLENRIAPRIGTSLVGALGCAVLVIGVVIAWRADSPTGVLVAGAVLIGVAMFGGEGGRIQAKYKDWSIDMSRRAAEATNEAAKQVEQVAQQQQVPEEARKELVAISERLDEVSRRAEASSNLFGDFGGQSAGVGQFEASHREQEGSVLLQLRFSAPTKSALRLADSPILCRVEGPDGKVAYAVPRSFGLNFWILGTHRYSATFPQDFRKNPERLPPGQYQVGWIRAEGGDFALATDSFVWPPAGQAPDAPPSPGPAGPATT